MPGGGKPNLLQYLEAEKELIKRAWGSMNGLQKASIITTPIPIAPDILGLLGDAQMYAQHPEERTLSNYGLSALGLLPIIPGNLKVLPDMISDYKKSKFGFIWRRKPDGTFYASNLNPHDAKALDALNETNQKSLAWANYDKSGNLLATGEDWVTKPNRDSIAKASEEAKILSKIWENNGPEPYYFRLGDIPESGKSINAITGAGEKGVSVYKAVPDAFGQYAVDPGIDVIPAMRILDRPAYKITGEIAGYGADGEPLLRNARLGESMARDDVLSVLGFK